MEKYKFSKYNVFKQFDKETVVVCNLVTKNIFGLDISKYQMLLQNAMKLSILENKNPYLLSALTKLGVVVDNEIDETNKILMIHRKQIYDNPTYRITVLPTLDCNFNCWYCYEEHSKDYMTSTIQKTIQKHVKAKLNDSNVKHMALDWFGGEPLLCFDDIVYPLSRKIKQECDKRGVLFSNSMTSNGSLITTSMIKKFKRIDLSSFQITLDGDETYHNKTKRSVANNNEYRNLLNIFFKLADNIENLNLLVRINYSPQNIDTIHNIIKDFPKEQRSKMWISFQQVWQTQHESLEHKINEVVKEFESEGFKVNKPNIDNSFYKCYADVCNQIVVAPNGNVFKCTARDFANHSADGVLQKDGSIQWRAPYYDRMCKTTIENGECLDCKLLPACWGPCSQKILEYKPHEFNKICNKEGVKKTIESLMNDFYETKICRKTKKNY